MAFSIGISDVWKMFEWANQRKAENKKAVFEWLECVYADLDELAKVWIDICDALERLEPRTKYEISDPNVQKALNIIRRGKDSMSQNYYAGRLRQFYESATLVKGKAGLPLFDAQFIDHMGEMLYARREARQLLENDLVSDINVMRNKIFDIQEHVVALQVLIRTLKTQA